MKIGRPRKYKSARALERGIERYFASISFDEPVIVRGDPITKWDEKQQANVPVLAKKTCWIEPPSIEAMCLFLGISTSTWANYEKLEEYEGAVSRARGRILAYLMERLDSGKGTNGAKFRLECMHGWTPGGEKLNSQNRLEMEPELEAYRV